VSQKERTSPEAIELMAEEVAAEIRSAEEEATRQRLREEALEAETKTEKIAYD
jgi:hypothetical protein